MLLSKAVEGYFYDKSTIYSESTLESYHYVFKLLIAHIGDQEISEVQPNQLKAFLVWLKQDYVPNRFNGDTSPLSPAGVDLHWKGIRSLFKWAYQTLDVVRPDLDLPRPHYDRPQVKSFSEDEVRRLLKASDQRIPTARRNKALILFLLDTGLRLGEALRIKMQDINFENGEILVAPYGTGRKTKPRMVFVGNTAKRALWLYVARIDDARPADRLFPMSKVAVRIMLKRLSVRSGVADVYPHRFRHSFAIWFLRGGGDVFTLQRMLGHSTLEMVNYYLDIAQSDIAIAHKRASAVDRWNANQPL